MKGGWISEALASETEQAEFNLKERRTNQERLMASSLRLGTVSCRSDHEMDSISLFI